MKTRIFITVFLSAVFVFQPVASPAFETDQYNLPPVPLADIGDEVSEYVEEHLRMAVANVNAEITDSRACLNDPKSSKDCDSARRENKKLAYLLSNDAVARKLFKLIGDGNLFITKTGKWFDDHKFRGQPDRYKPPYSESIFILNPTDYLTLSPTVRLFGAEFGTDKIEHFLQQGYDYFEIYNKSIAKNRTPAQAEKKAVAWGQLTERTYFGILSSGVYSNADLYANYVGMKFYLGLTKPLEINGKTRPATIALRDGKWQIMDPALRENLIKPFLTDHLNEALNASAFRLTLVRSVRRAIKKHSCPEWHLAYPTLTANELTLRSKALERWNGEDYGYTKKHRIVTIAGICFGDEPNGN